MLLDSEAANRYLKTQEKSLARTVNVPAFSPTKACFSFLGAVVVVGIPNSTYTRNRADYVNIFRDRLTIFVQTLILFFYDPATGLTAIE